MKVEVKHGEGLKRELTIVVPVEQFQTEMDKKYDEVQQTVTIKGFRKGKAPMNMIKTLYGDEVKADVLDELIKTTLPEAVRMETLRVATKPMLTDLKFNDDGAVVYTATLEVFPEVPQIVFDTLEIHSYDAKIKDEEVDQVVEYFRKRLAEERTVTREIQKEDLVIADLKKTADPNLVVEVNEFPDSKIDLSNTMTMKEFRDQLPGLKIGDEKQIEIVYPETYSDARLAGAIVTFMCKIKEIKERLLPDVDDGFAKQTGMAETALELRLKIRDNLKLQQEETQVREQRQELIRQICQTNQVPIPEGMVEEYLDSVIEDLKKSNQEINEEEIRQTYRQVGVDEMRWAILWHELADQQKIEVLPSDSEKWIEGFASRNGITTDAARDALTKSGKVKELRNSLLEEKVLEFLLGKAKRVQITKDNKDS